MTNEEQRALDWQDARRRRREFKRSLQSHLTAPGANKVALEADWDPLRNKVYAVEHYSDWELEDIEYEQSHSTVQAYSLRRDGDRTRN